MGLDQTMTETEKSEILRDALPVGIFTRTAEEGEKLLLEVYRAAIEGKMAVLQCVRIDVIKERTLTFTYIHHHADRQSDHLWSPPEGEGEEKRLLLYLLYTSGSSGFPKGVVGTQEGTLHRCHWMWKQFPFEEGEVVAHRTSLAFVDSVWEIFGTLLAGAALLIVPQVETLSPSPFSSPSRSYPPPSALQFSPRPWSSSLTPFSGQRLQETIYDPKAFIALLRAKKATRFSCVPSYLDLLLSWLRKQHRSDGHYSCFLLHSR